MHPRSTNPYIHIRVPLKSARRLWSEAVGLGLALPAMLLHGSLPLARRREQEQDRRPRCSTSRQQQYAHASGVRTGPAATATLSDGPFK